MVFIWIRLKNSTSGHQVKILCHFEHLPLLICTMLHVFAFYPCDFKKNNKNPSLKKERCNLISLILDGLAHFFFVVVQMKWKETLKSLSALNLNTGSFSLEGSIP